MKILYENTISKLDELKAKYQSALLKVDKIKNTIYRHQSAIEKNKAKIEKELGVSYEEADDLYRNHRDQFRELCNNDWEKMDLVYKIHSKESDIKSNESKLEDAKASVQKWHDKLEQERKNQEKISNDIPKILIDFMEEWKQNAIEYYLKSYKDYVKFEQELRLKELQARYDLMMSDDDFARARQWYDETQPLDSHDNWSTLHNHLGNYRKVEDKLKELKLDYKSIRDALNNHSNYYIPRLMGMSEEEQKVYLDNALEKEKNTMILDLYRRINEEVGDITDASDLKINAGNLNGIVIGTNGKARVETIGAGGYNADVVLDSGRHGQRFHFRTLIHKIKER